MAWFKVDDGLHASRKLLSIPRRHRFAAVGLWTVAGSWSADQLTDGHVPDYMIAEWSSPPAAASALVDSGLWTRESSGFAFHNWHEYQPSKADVDAERAASKERMRELRARRKQRKPLDSGAESGTLQRTVTNGSENVRNPDPTRPDPTLKKEPLSVIADAIPRPDVDSLLDLLDQGIKSNGLKIPSRTKRNSDAIRLLLDRDGYTADQVGWIIRWACADEFWRANILSASKLREKFSQLMAKAGVGQAKAVAGFNGEIDPDAILGKDYWQPPAPPEGMGIQEEIAWKKQQRAERQAGRIEQAKRKVVEDAGAV